MTIAQFFSGFFSQIWSVFQVDSPFPGLTFAEWWLGFFVVSIAALILKKAFELGFSLSPHAVRYSNRRTMVAQYNEKHPKGGSNK